MSSVATELDETLQKLNAEEASLLERLVRDALALVHQTGSPSAPTNGKGWPAGYFDQTAGSFANEPFDFPDNSAPMPN